MNELAITPFNLGSLGQVFSVICKNPGPSQAMQATFKSSGTYSPPFGRALNRLAPFACSEKRVTDCRPKWLYVVMPILDFMPWPTSWPRRTHPALSFGAMPMGSKKPSGAVTPSSLRFSSESMARYSPKTWRRACPVKMSCSTSLKWLVFQSRSHGHGRVMKKVASTCRGSWKIDTAIQNMLIFYRNKTNG